jgi:aspartyl/asparaginyl beta-hydroxylase (cupin superfamily)
VGIAQELFPSSLQEVDEILWTGRSQLEMLCSLKELSESHIVLQANSNIPEVGTRGIFWLPHFRIFPAVICERTETTFTAKFEGLDAVMKKSLDFFLYSRKTGAKRKRPNIFKRSLIRAVYLTEQRLQDIERRTFSPKEFPWSLDFEKHSDSIRKEVENIFNNIDFESIPYALDRIPKARSVLVAQQGKVEPNAKQLLPAISRLVANVPSLANAELSVLAPGAELRLHKAGNRCFLRMHLGIIVPKGDVCLELEGERLEWKEGKVMIFDDFYPHTAWNRTEQTRVILMVDLFRPMHKWQERFMRFAQRRIIPSIPSIPDKWLSW